MYCTVCTVCTVHMYCMYCMYCTVCTVYEETENLHEHPHQGHPCSTRQPIQLCMWVFSFGKNRTQTSTTVIELLYNLTIL